MFCTELHSNKHDTLTLKKTACWLYTS